MNAIGLQNCLDLIKEDIGYLDINKSPIFFYKALDETIQGIGVDTLFNGHTEIKSNETFLFTITKGNAVLNNFYFSKVKKVEDFALKTGNNDNNILNNLVITDKVTINNQLLLSGNSPTEDNEAISKFFLENKIAEVVSNAIIFKGFISAIDPLTIPIEDLRDGNLWYQPDSSLSEPPATNPWENVKMFSGSGWTDFPGSVNLTTGQYRPYAGDRWSNLDDDSIGWYYEGSKWHILNFNDSNFNSSIFETANGEITLKDGSIGNSLLGTNISGSKLLDDTITKAKLESNVQASLSLADTALQLIPLLKDANIATDAEIQQTKISGLQAVLNNKYSKTNTIADGNLVIYDLATDTFKDSELNKDNIATTVAGSSEDDVLIADDTGKVVTSGISINTLLTTSTSVSDIPGAVSSTEQATNLESSMGTFGTVNVDNNKTARVNNLFLKTAAEYNTMMSDPSTAVDGIYIIIDG